MEWTASVWVRVPAKGARMEGLVTQTVGVTVMNHLQESFVKIFHHVTKQNQRESIASFMAIALTWDVEMKGFVNRYIKLLLMNTILS